MTSGMETNFAILRYEEDVFYDADQVWNLLTKSEEVKSNLS